MFKVVDYSRVSTEEEKQMNALKIQQEENEEFIKKQDNWILVDRYIDEGKSATTTKGRDDFKRLLRDMETNKFDIILIKIIDRGWRNTLDWKLFEKSLIINKKQLFIKSRNCFYNFNNPTDYMATGFEAQFAEWSSINQSIKMNQAHKTRMRKGTVVTNGRIWGYDQVDAKLIINEEEAKIVKFIFNEYIQGKGFRTIAKELENMGIKNQNGNSFALTTLKRIIKQEKYKGTLICGKRHKNFWTKEYEEIPEDEWVIHENVIPSIISKEIWEKANDILKNKRKEFGLEDKCKIKGYFQGNYPLSGKICCSKCNRVYYHSKYTTMKYPIWECFGYREYGKKHEKGCDNIRISEPYMDAAVKQAILKFWENRNEILDDFLNDIKDELQNDNNKESLKKLEIEQNKLKNKKEKLFDLFVDETITKQEYKDKNDTLNIELEKLNEQITSIKNVNSIIKDKQDKVNEIKKNLNQKIESIEFISDDIIKNFVKKVIVYPNKNIQVFIIPGHSEIIKKEDNLYENVTTKVQEWSQIHMEFKEEHRINPISYNVKIYVTI